MRIAVVVALAVSSRVAWADQPDRTSITLREALNASARAPAASVPGHEIVAAEALVDAAAAWPDPSVHIGTNRLTARLVAGATVPLPIFGTVGAARAHARAEADVVRSDADLFQRGLRRRVVEAWVALARADGDVVTSAIAAQQAAELELIARGRLEAGEGADVDVTVAGAARARADVAAAEAERAEDAASAELAAVLGWDPAIRLRAEGGLDVGHAGDLDALRARLAIHPERTAALRRVAAADASVAEAKTAYWPMVAIDAEISIDDPTLTNVQGQLIGPDAQIGIAFDLPIFAHVGDKVRVARATADAERARLAVTQSELAGSLVAAYRRWQAASEQVEAIDRDVLPAQERAAALSAQAYREGARDLATALVAERDLAAVRAELNHDRADAATAFAELQLAVGGEVGDAK
jgi:cobalt-zinc-cadmium efflux system outer membrane protein